MVTNLQDRDDVEMTLRLGEFGQVALRASSLPRTARERTLLLTFIPKSRCGKKRNVVVTLSLEGDFRIEQDPITSTSEVTPESYDGVGIA